MISSLIAHIRVFSKVCKTQLHNPKFGPKPGEIQNNLQEHISIQSGEGGGGAW